MASVVAIQEGSTSTLGVAQLTVLNEDKWGRPTRVGYSIGGTSDSGIRTVLHLFEVDRSGTRVRDSVWWGVWLGRHTC